MSLPPILWPRRKHQHERGCSSALRVLNGAAALACVRVYRGLKRIDLALSETLTLTSRSHKSVFPVSLVDLLV